MERKKAWKNSGSALVVAIVIMLLVMMLSLAMLLACYSLRKSAVKQRNVEQCKEIAQSVSKELTAEITHEFSTYAEAVEAMTTDKYPLWSYLRFNLWQTSWPYLNEDEAHHQEADAYKSFTLNYNAAGTEKVPGDVTVVMYWESELGNVKADGAVTPFYIEVTCQIGEQKSTITSEYELHIEKGKPDYPVEDNGDQPGGENGQTGNPYHNQIQNNEKWTFYFVERE